MSTERWQQLDRIFIEAIQRPADERCAFIEEACRTDTGLKTEALTLLAAADESSDFMSTSALEHLARTVAAAGWTLKPGDRVGAYTVLNRLGAGAVGEVWRARDERLGRDVAIKIVAPYASSDSERLRRFAEEARLAGSLNHPNLLTVHDVGEHAGLPMLVTECLDGQSLRQRLEAGPLPVGKAINVALGITRGLAAAHARGIVHRDVKPENVFLQTDGNVKILDFGLAKLLPSVGSEPGARHQTMDGWILGTAGYMAPEQVRGEPADSRADLFAVGVMTYEMLAGSNPFKRASIVETMHATLTADVPDLTADGRAVPPAVAKLVRRLLETSPQARFQSAQDLAWALEQLSDQSSSDRTPSRETPARRPAWRRGWAAAIVVLAAGVVGAGISWTRGSGDGASRAPLEPAAGVVRSTLMLPPDAPFDRPKTLAFSPDSTMVVYPSLAQGRPRLFKRRLADGQTTTIDGTGGGEHPFFSPDGQWLGYVDEGRIWKMRVDGGTPIVVATLSSVAGASWGDDGYIVAGRYQESGLWRVPAAGGTPEQLTEVTDEDGSNDHRWPQALPGGRGVLFSVSTGPEESARIVVLDARTGTRKDLVKGSASARYVPTGYLVYARSGELQAAPFDLDRLEVTGPATRVAGGVNEDSDGEPEYAMSDRGDLVYAPGWSGGPRSTLTFLDFQGRAQDTAFPRMPLYVPRFSADGRRVAVTVGGAKNNVWLYDIERGLATRVTNGRYHDPLWTADGHLVMSKGPPGDMDLVRRSADGDGAEEILVPSGQAQYTGGWTFDGRLVFQRQTATVAWDILAYDPATGEVSPIVATPASEERPRTSPDGRWMSYTSDESGRDEVYVRGLGQRTPRQQVSTNNAIASAWAPDGRTLYFVTRFERSLWAASIATSPALSVGRPRRLFDLDGYESLFDVSPDGKRFAVVRSGPQPPRDRLELVVNALASIATPR